MRYDFDKPTNRFNTGSLKWDVEKGELPMWVADMDFETLPEVKDAIMKIAERGIYGYSVIPDEYFESISAFWKRRHFYEFAPSDMVYSSGIVAALSSMVRKLSTPAENVLIQPPVYNMFYNSILNNGRRVLENKLIYENGEYRMDFVDLEEKLKDPQTSLMILCNPHNPVGKIWDRETLARVGELCKKYGVTVISDEIHSSITVRGKSYIPFASVNETCRDISVSCIACSKTFNLAGLQSSAVVAQNPVLRHRVWRGINTDEVGEPNVFSMAANIAAYTYGDEWLDEFCDYVFENKRFAAEYLKENAPKLYVVPSEATYLLWIDVSAYTDNSKKFAEELRRSTGLYVSSGASYGPGGEFFIRVNLATQRYNVEDGMARLASFVRELGDGRV